MESAAYLKAITCGRASVRRDSQDQDANEVGPYALSALLRPVFTSNLGMSCDFCDFFAIFLRISRFFLQVLRILRFFLRFLRFFLQFLRIFAIFIAHVNSLQIRGDFIYKHVRIGRNKRASSQREIAVNRCLIYTCFYFDLR